MYDSVSSNPPPWWGDTTGTGWLVHQYMGQTRPWTTTAEESEITRRLELQMIQQHEPPPYAHPRMLHALQNILDHDWLDIRLHTSLPAMDAGYSTVYIY